MRLVSLVCVSCCVVACEEHTYTPHGVSSEDDASSAPSAASSSAAPNEAANDAQNPASSATPSAPIETSPLDKWIRVTPAEMTVPAYGPGGIAKDPARPSDVYVGGGGDGVWKSTDYGATWTKILDVGYSAIGVSIAVAGTTPATLWVSAGAGEGGALLRSKDGGAHWAKIGGGLPDTLYSIKVDPYDADHLISGLHELDGVVESTNGGESWQLRTGSNFPSGGKSWFPFFIDKGDATTTRGSWIAIAQDGGSAALTSDGGATWNTPEMLKGLTHPHGIAQIYQEGSTLYVPGLYGDHGNGVFMGTSYGAGTWTHVFDGDYGAVAWKTPQRTYSMYGWACGDCDMNGFWVGDGQASNWQHVLVPEQLAPNNVAVTFDGKNYIFIAPMWTRGIWRYIEKAP